MPLSDEEARLLHQLEQSLAAEDPDFASTLRGSKFLAHNRRVAILAVLAGQLRMNLSLFLVLGLVGRWLRFVAVLGGVEWLIRVGVV